MTMMTQDQVPPTPPDEEETEHERRMTNIGLLVAAVLVVGGGIWLVNALVDARKAEECFESGRRNCNPVSVERKAQ
jgi:hypothetical protein